MENKEDKCFKSINLSFDDFFDLFIALSYVKGKRYLNIDSFKGFLKRYYPNYTKTQSDLNKSLNRLVRSNIVTYDFENDNIDFDNELEVLKMMSKNAQYIEKVYNVINSYEDYCKERTALAYDLMIDKEAIDRYNEDVSQRIREEIDAHARYGHL